MYNEFSFKSEIIKEVERERLARRILGVTAADGVEKIKKAFWLLAMEYHPDRRPGDGEAERRFQNIVNPSLP